MKKRWIVFPVVLALITGLIATGCDNEPGNTEQPAGSIIDYTVDTFNGIPNEQDTTILMFNFTKDGESYVLERNGLYLEDITITDGTGSITAIELTNSTGPTRRLTITVEEQGDIDIQVNKTGFVNEVKTVPVYKRLGLEAGDGNITDIVKLGGTPALPEDSPITFMRNIGRDIAVLPPMTTEPITSITTANPAFEHVLAVFNPPLNMTGTGDFRWIDMEWDGFGKEYDFDEPSTSGSYTGTRWDLHNVVFELDLTTSADETVRFRVTSETDTSTGAKKPVRFLKSTIQTGAALTAWGDGHSIKSVTLRVSSMQLRSPTNEAWPAINADRNPVIEDTWIYSLIADRAAAPDPLVLYSSTIDGEGERAGEWIEDFYGSEWLEIMNPKYSEAGDDAFNNATALDARTIPAWTGGAEGTDNNRQKTVRWDPIAIPDQPGRAPYSVIVVVYEAEGQTSLTSWFGYGIISGHPVNSRNKLQNFDGGSYMITGGGIRIPLDPKVYGEFATFNREQFSGFFLQWLSGTITITEIRLE